MAHAEEIADSPDAPVYEDLGVRAYDRSMGGRATAAAGTSQRAAAAAPVCSGAAYCATYTILGDQNPQSSYQNFGYQSIKVTNNGTATWTASGSTQVKLGYHLKRNGATYGPTQLLLTTLPGSVAPGASRTFTAMVQKVAHGHLRGAVGGTAALIGDI